MSSTAAIGVGGLAASLVLVAVALGLSGWQRLGLNRSILWASARAGVQLLAVGAALVLVLDPDAPLAWSWLWVVGMVVFAGVTVRNRAREVPGLAGLAVLAMAVVVIVSLSVVFGLEIFPMEGRTIVPLAGMMIGNSMTASVIVARRIVGELADKRDEVEARLALGQPWPEAARPYVRAALRTALVPQIESTKAVGLVFLPGAMTGLILAGVDAGDAVLVQLAIMYLILGSVACSVTVIGLGLTRRLFTRDHRLVPLARVAS
ncbi:ABC transporter permease [Rhabdothermincola salaria]|uniref:ABC transporter permease n=1 Tax=Rhabdothermincola salaria TaxID=2903142 RepID=UPI001E569384|nr:iron export ABC transporter permease subunit FetB [Rhabdothermincola salaria]MCD9623357.1 iron export ABC transporter permease subunit FetB [Rhabdothermincola salaria]